MTYSILALPNADFLGTYATRDEALSALAAAVQSDPDKLSHVCVAGFDDDGRVADKVEGAQLREAVAYAAPARLTA